MGQEDLQKRIRELAPAKVSAWVACLADAVQCEALGAEGILSLDLAPVLKELDARYLATAHAVGLGNHPLAAEIADQAAAAREKYGLDAWLRQAVIDRAAAASGIDPKELGRRFDERVDLRIDNGVQFV
jgi:hypothetical protein